MNFASEKGHLHIVEWLHENRNEGCTTKAMDKAALNGHYDIIVFLYYIKEVWNNLEQKRQLLKK
jgi:hypothetical protein